MSAPETPSDSDPRAQAALRLLTGEFELRTGPTGHGAAGDERWTGRLRPHTERIEAARRSGALAHV